MGGKEAGGIYDRDVNRIKKKKEKGNNGQWEVVSQKNNSAHVTGLTLQGGMIITTLTELRNSSVEQNKVFHS